MNNKIAIVALFAFLNVACTHERKIEISPESFTENELARCADQKCPEVTINYLKVYGDEEISEKINRKIKNFILKSLLMGEDTTATANSIKEGAAQFVESYFADKARFPDMVGEYFAEISVNEIYTTPTHLCFEMRQYLFTGGAHGYGTTSFLNIDPKTGEMISKEQLFNNKEKFTKFAESKFRNSQQITEGQSLNESGFWFENDTFYLPESIGFTQDSLILIYNQYDIASYAEGPIELKIPLNQAAPFLKFQ